MNIKPIIGIFAVATGTIFLTACDDAEKVGGAQILANLGISDPVTVATLAEVPRVEEAAPEPVALAVAAVPAEPVECSVPASMFRSHWCNPDTGKFEPIP